MPQTEIRLFRTAKRELPLVNWLDDLQARFPKAYEKCVAAVLALSRDGNQLRRPLADYLRDGIYELRTKVGRVHYRMLYAFHGKNIAILTRGFTKERRVPVAEIEAAIACMKSVRQDPNKYTADFEL